MTSNAYIAFYDDHDASAYGTNLVIQSAGNVFIGGGESPSGLYNAIGVNSTTESMYVTADADVFIESNV